MSKTYQIPVYVEVSGESLDAAFGVLVEAMDSALHRFKAIDTYFVNDERAQVYDEKEETWTAIDDEEDEIRLAPG